MARALLCFLNSIIAGQCMNATERKESKTLVSFPVEEAAWENLKGCGGDPVHVHKALNLSQEFLLTSFKAPNKNTET